jgi:hypothetical protein
MLEKLIVFVEEYSMAAALELLLPKMLGDIGFQIIRFQCKDDLLKNAPARLKGYAGSLPRSWRIIVLVDRDNDDCQQLKKRLELMAIDAGLRTKRTARKDQQFQAVSRIAIEELEAWFFGDWAAVQAAYPRVSPNVPRRAGFRDPDAIVGGTWEALERELKKAGYFSTGMRKLEVARSVASRMEISRNRSGSFQAFSSAVTAAMQ